MGTPTCEKRSKIKVNYERNPISLLHDSRMSSALNCCFLSILLQPKKEDHIRRKINSKKNISEISIIVLICRTLASVGSTQFKLPSPKRDYIYLYLLIISQCIFKLKLKTNLLLQQYF